MISRKTVVSTLTFLVLSLAGLVLAGCPDKASGTTTTSTASGTPTAAASPAASGAGSAKSSSGSGW